MEALVTLAFVICALGAVMPVDSVSVAEEIFVDVKFDETFNDPVDRDVKLP